MHTVIPNTHTNLVLLAAMPDNNNQIYIQECPIIGWHVYSDGAPVDRPQPIVCRKASDVWLIYDKETNVAWNRSGEAESTKRREDAEYLLEDLAKEKRPVSV